jgi:CBS domain-containing protein
MRNSIARPTRVEDLMTNDVVTLTPGDPVDRARDIMLSLAIHGLPIIDEDDRVVGMVTSHDLVDDWPPAEPLETVMRRNVVTIDAQAGLVEAAELMKSELVHHLVVVSGRRPCGVISTYDMLDALIEGAPATA